MQASLSQRVTIAQVVSSGSGIDKVFSLAETVEGSPSKSAEAVLATLNKRGVSSIERASALDAATILLLEWVGNEVIPPETIQCFTGLTVGAGGLLYFTGSTVAIASFVKFPAMEWDSSLQQHHSLVVFYW